jgi:hypothetical protein
MALSMYVGGVGSAEVTTALRDAGFRLQQAGDDAVDSPVQVVGAPGLHALEVRDDAGGVWIWAVADNLHARAAAAVAAIHTLLGIPLSDALQ